MDTKRFFRYLAPNLVTLCSLIFGMLSIKCSVEGQFEAASWFILLSVLTDKLDGFVARLVRGTSEFGVQLDSFADFLNFGIAPATLWYTYFTRADDLPWASGSGRVILLACCALWMLAVTFRLARYNIVGDDPRCRHIFFGVPTTMAGGWVVSIFLSFVKYGDLQYRELAQASFAHEPALYGSLHIGRGAWLAFPALIVIGAILMASTVRFPKLGKSKIKAVTIFIFANVFAGYVIGFMRILPEYLASISTVYIIVALPWGVLSKDVRGLRAPPIFPKQDHPPGKEPQRPEDDALAEEDPEPGAAA
jgi:CDP-diacylglycerol--serine O-phosphatidyltransferase